MFHPNRRTLILLSAGLLSATVAAQQSQPSQPTALTADDYARAERFMSYNTAPLVLHSAVRPTWTADDRFWYRTRDERGDEAWLVDAATGTKTVCDLPQCKAPVSAAAGSTDRSGS